MSGSRASKKAAAKARWCRPREREATRLAILDATQRLIALHGLDVLTLSAIADEAGLARATLYGYFSSKRQLLAQLNGEEVPEPPSDDPPDEAPQIEEAAEPSALVGEQAAADAQQVAETTESLPLCDEQAPDEGSRAEAFLEQPEAADELQPNQTAYAEDAIDAPVEEMPVDTETAMSNDKQAHSSVAEPSPAFAEETPTVETLAADPVVSGADHQADEPANETADTTVEGAADYAAVMRLQAEELDRLTKRIIIPKSMARDGTDVVITRLEARLRILEKSVTDVDARRGQEARDLAGRLDTAMAAIQQLQKQLETANGRHQQSLAELRLDVHNLAHTGGTATVAPPVFCAEPSFDLIEPVAADVDAAEPAAEVAAPSPEAEQPSGEPAQRPYLSSARRAAIEAARQVETRTDADIGSSDGRWRWLLGIFILIAAAMGAVIGTRPHAAAHDGSAVLESRQSIAELDKARGPVSAFERLAALAARGNTSAQLVLGQKLLNGTGMAMNIEKAAVWLERAAEGGQPIAQESLGVLYQTGTGVAANMSKAMQWYDASAQQGNVKAMANLAKAYAGGSAQGADFTKAAKWFTRAAELGDVDSQFDLAVLYERGEGVTRNLADAYKWYSIAAGQGDRDAAAQAAILAAQLAPQELAAAKKAAAGFKPEPVDKRANDVPSITMRSAERG
ncbi:MAG: SEL1-like repeat protein [Alphaproteobacteria bacterium]|nr:SEL1-like repeat protein [Alphaproteobacteria bacterium]